MCFLNEENFPNPELAKSNSQTSPCGDTRQHDNHRWTCFNPPQLWAERHFPSSDEWPLIGDVQLLMLQQLACIFGGVNFQWKMAAMLGVHQELPWWLLWKEGYVVYRHWCDSTSWVRVKTADPSILDSFLTYTPYTQWFRDLEQHTTPNTRWFASRAVQVAFGRPCKTFGHQKHDGQFRQLWWNADFGEGVWFIIFYHLMCTFLR